MGVNEGVGVSVALRVAVGVTGVEVGTAVGAGQTEEVQNQSWPVATLLIGLPVVGSRRLAPKWISTIVSVGRTPGHGEVIAN
jgi:hypothetical protein